MPPVNFTCFTLNPDTGEYLYHELQARSPQDAAEAAVAEAGITTGEVIVFSGKQTTFEVFPRTLIGVRVRLPKSTKS